MRQPHLRVTLRRLWTSTISTALPWDFPPYWLLIVVAAFMAAPARRFVRAAVVGGILLGAGILLYLPYLLTAQSQANGIGVNFFNPTRLPQFLWMFLPALLALGALLVIAWRDLAPRRNVLVWLVVITLGAPILFLGGSWALVQNSSMADAFTICRRRRRPRLKKGSSCRRRAHGTTRPAASS